MRIFTLLFGCCLTLTAASQIHLGVSGGISNYYGDLNDRPFNRPKAAAGISAAYEISDKLELRAGILRGAIEGADRFSGSDYLIKNRNLHFQSPLTEVSLAASYSIFNLYNMHWSPYVFGGISVFRFNPSTQRSSGEKVYLHPLGTEGQGVNGRPRYALTDLSLPYGGGVHVKLHERWRLSVEMGLRKTFTDYLDDVSGFYADPNDLNPLARELAYRGGEAGGPTAYPTKGYERGNPARKDGYYFTLLHLQYKIFTRHGRNSRRFQLDHCPSVER